MMLLIYDENCTCFLLSATVALKVVDNVGIGSFGHVVAIIGAVPTLARGGRREDA